MSAIDEILGKLPLDQLAAQLGSDPEAIRVASTEAISSLMGGLQRNSSEPLGQVSLAAALKDHSASQLLSDSTAIDLNQIDQTDGTKIVQHVLGADPATAAQNLRGGKADQSLIQRLLPILAPIVLAYLGSKLGNRQIEAGRSGQQASGQQASGSILDSILGLGGQLNANPSQDYQRGYQDGYQAARTEGQQAGGMNLGDLIGGMMGQQPAKGGLGGLLGGLFG